MLVFDKFVYNGETDYNISIQHSRYDRKLNTLRGRIARACKTLFGKPIYYNDVQIMDEQKFKDFIFKLNDLVDDTVSLNADVHDGIVNEFEKDG
jgi:hypothetical protein